jgi:hypothetical protein
MSLANRGWDITAPFGFEGEAIVADLLALPVDRREVEVKRKTFADSVFYIEVECQYHTGWGPSGISTTEAGYWAFLVSDTGVAVLIPTARVRAAVALAKVKRVALKPGASGGDHPTRGYLVPFQFFVEKSA